MQNLDQIRAAAADTLCKPRQGQTNPDFDRSNVASIPALILTNGLLAAAAFCCENDKDARKGMKAAFAGIAKHLQERRILNVVNNQGHRSPAPDGHQLINYLVVQDSHTLQRATTEALAFLSYLKRFALPKKKDTTP